MPAIKKTRFLAYSLLLLNAALWGFAAPIIKNSLNFVTPELFLLTRFIIAASIYFPIFLLSRSKHKYKNNYPLLIGLGLLGTPLTLFPLFLGLQHTSSLEASIIESSSPIITVLGGLFFLKEIVKKKEWVGLIVAIFGTLLLTVEPIIKTGFSASPSLTGNLLILLSNLMWATFLLISKKTKTNPTSLTLVSFLVSIPFFLFLTISKGTLGIPSHLAFPGIIYMAVFGSIVAFWAYQEGQKLIDASEAAVFSYLKPVFTIPLAIFWLKEDISIITIASAIIIALGVFISEKR